MTADAPDLLLKDVEVYPSVGRADCRVRGGVVVESGPRLRAGPREFVVRGDGGALLPGLADHHLHLTAMAARRTSIDLSSGAQDGPDGPALMISRAVAGDDGWIRAVGYDDVVHGELDRDVLDSWNRAVPVRVQHRSGALWLLNSPGLDRLGASTAAHEGIERDRLGRPTGRLWRADAWLREALGAPPPSLRTVGTQLASFGVTHVADATPDAGAAGVVADAAHRGELPQHVMVMAPGIVPAAHPRLSVGPVKLVVADHAPPDLDDLTGRVRRAHAEKRPVAVHCVTRTALALTLAVLDRAGTLTGDRVEHCAVTDLPGARELAARGLRVVTQPTLATHRGDDYWERAEPEDRPDLWRYASLLRAGVRVAPSSDAPYGDPDPWACLRAATDRLTPSKRVLGPGERVPAGTVLRGMLSPLRDPGGPERRVTAGSSADLVLLDRPLADALRAPDAGQVRATLVRGRIVYGAENLG
ncbi:amidohydrolase family protein [Streptomyces sp. NPDC087903]|uniref:amidohydrolase family protein n=1 Tax=Streptomyces sp. NPDC087903 TaxID=3365819 RepID=UPI003812C428